MQTQEQKLTTDVEIAMAKPPEGKQGIINYITAPEDLEVITAHDRLMWRINDVLCKVMHEAFLGHSPLDVIVIKGSYNDHTAFGAVAQALTSQRWVTGVATKEDPLDGIVLIAARSERAMDLATKHMGGEKIDNRKSSATSEAQDTEPGTEGRGSGEDKMDTPSSEAVSERN